MGQALKVVDGLTGQFEYVTVSAKEAADYLSQLTSEKYRRTGGIQPEVSTSTKTTIPTLPESDKERRERERKEREAARKAREALKKDLDERKAAYLQAEAENLTMYVTGTKNYADYCAEREKLERDYVDDVVQIHLDHNKLDIAAYGAALKEKAQIQKRQKDAERKRNLAELEKDHTETDNKLVAAYWDANSPDFQNERLLNQMLFQEDQRYLQEKAKLYLEGSEERAAIEREIAEKLAQDQLNKQKETAQAYMQFEQQYRQASGSRREQMEMELLQRLYEQGLISEQEYQKALRDIKDKNRDHDIDNARKVQSEYADMVVNLYTSFSDFFSNLGSEGINFWDDLAKCAQAAFAVMGAALSQYSAYSNAERDLELAKVEKRYDAEI